MFKEPDQASEELFLFNNVRGKIVWFSHDGDPLK